MRFRCSSILVILAMLLFCGQGAFCQGSNVLVEENIQQVIWHVKAIHPDGYTMDVKAVDADGGRHDIIFFGSIGSFLYVFRPLAALFLGQELSQYKPVIKEAPLLMLIPMLILSVLNVATGVLPSPILEYINTILVDAGIPSLTLTTWVVTGNNGDLFPALISGIFALGVGLAFILFIVLKKSRKVELMDTYTAGNFIYNEELMHYSVDFYAPIERLYERYTTKVKDFYENVAHKVKEVGQVVKYFVFSHKPEITVFWIVIVLIILLWGDVQ